MPLSSDTDRLPPLATYIPLSSTIRPAVSAYIGRYFRNRSAPAQRGQQLSGGDDGGPHPRSLVSAAGAYGFLGTPAGPENLQSQSSLPRVDQLPLLRPVVEYFVPAYPIEHRQKVFDVLDFHIHYLAARLTHWGTGPTPFMRCWVQMVCGDMALFDSVAAFIHGVRLTTLEDQVTPSATMLWHKARALRGLQAKISTEAEDKETIWRASETILATFYLMEGAARFGYESEFKTHCLGLLRMMQLRGEVASACLKDLYVTQAVGLVEGTEMASELRHGIDSHDGSPSTRDALTTATASAITTKSKLRYPHPDLQFENPLWATVNASPAGFHDLVTLGNLSIEFILLLDDLLGSMDQEQLQRYNGITEATERQTKLVRRARLLEKESHNAVERLACLGVIAFLTRRTSQMQMFPEMAFIDKLTTLGRHVTSSDLVGTSCYHDLRVWATLVGLEITDTAGVTLKQHAHEAMTELLFQERCMDSWDDVERIARRYLWDEKSLTAWKTYWMSYRDVS
ncbi:hypothetical protein B0J13DRAFT_576120 [Dactylonectria estremocensis]|uniref:Uncharacterized protein n=1 Tax=Dactylonectria estremocensis TaxID=1079267 RepID=A0A9P9D410_9HYPO|nr:hypothetical protein B0J13DRAFT_576120 [Dactylonectria estremocensis]